MSATAVFSWVSADHPCDPTSVAADSYDCSTSYMDFGNFSQCSADCEYSGGEWSCANYDDMQLTAIGYCYSQKVHGMEKKTAAFVLATLDAVSMFIFWIMLVYLNQWQEEAADQQNEDVCSADDYSVIIEGLPPAANEEAHK